LPNLAEGFLKALLGPNETGTRPPSNLPAGAQEIPISPADVSLAYGARTLIDSVANDPWFGFGPSQPMQPLAPAGTMPRTRDYQFGSNLYFAPRTEDPGYISFSQLRMLALYDIVRLCIETRKQQILKIPFQFRTEREPGEKNSQYNKRNLGDDRVVYLNTFFKFPDHENSILNWINMLCEEIFVTDALSIWPVLDDDNKVLALRQIDGSTIKPLHTPQGWRPAAPNPAYQQIVKGAVALNLTAGLCPDCQSKGWHSNALETSVIQTWGGPMQTKRGRCTPLIYFPFNPTVNKFYGFGPTEQVIRTIMMGMGRTVSQASWFNEGNIPEAIACVPDTWGLEQIKQLQAFMDQLSGDISIKRRVRFMPALSQYIQTKEAVLKNDFDEWLARVCCYAFNVAPTPLIRQMNRATSQSSAQAALEEGTLPTLGRIAEVITTAIRQYFGKEFADIEFAYKLDDQSDPAVQQKIADGHLKDGVWCIDEVRDDQGREPLPNGAGAIFRVYTPQGWTPIDQVDDLAQSNLDAAQAKVEQIKNPPPPTMPGQVAAGQKPQQKQIAAPKDSAAEKLLKALPAPRPMSLKKKAILGLLKYTYGSTQINIDSATSIGLQMQILRDSISDEQLAGKGRETQGHVTVRYGIQGAKTDGIRTFFQGLAPFDIQFGMVRVFPPTTNSDDAAVVHVQVISPELELINAALPDYGSFKDADFEYHPHATLAYVKPEFANLYDGIGTLDGMTYRVESIAICPKEDNEPAEIVQLCRKEPLAEKLAKYSEDQPRVPAGEPGGGEFGTIGEPVKFAPSEKMRIAMENHRGGSLEAQRIADQQERIISKALGLPRTPDNSPFDLRSAKIGVECKTMVESKNGKVTMNKDAIGRKVADAKGPPPLKYYTVVADKRGGSTQYYYKAGVGSFNVSAMTKTNLTELRGILRGKH
jgi:hypothetical protein